METLKLITKVFGEIEIASEKIIKFENGIIGFPDMKKFVLLFDEEKEEKQKVFWLQSVEEPALALPMLDPLCVKAEYNPDVEDELLKPLGNLNEAEMLVLTALTVPGDITKMTTNLKAPFIINSSENKGIQVIVEDDFMVRYPIYDILQQNKEKAGE